MIMNINKEYRKPSRNFPLVLDIKVEGYEQSLTKAHFGRKARSRKITVVLLCIRDRFDREIIGSEFVLLENAQLWGAAIGEFRWLIYTNFPFCLKRRIYIIISGEDVEMYGWLHYKRTPRFLVLRDCYGLTQALITDERQSKFNALVESLHYETMLRIRGKVIDRGANRNPKMPTGDIEVSNFLIESIDSFHRSKLTNWKR